MHHIQHAFASFFFFFFCHHQVYQIIKYFDEGIITTVISKDRTLAHVIYYTPHVPAFLAIIR